MSDKEIIESLREENKKLVEARCIEFAKWLHVDSYGITNPAAVKGKSHFGNWDTWQGLYDKFISTSPQHKPADSETQGKTLS